MSDVGEQIVKNIVQPVHAYAVHPLPGLHADVLPPAAARSRGPTGHRRRWLAAAVAGVAALLIGGAGLWLARHPIGGSAKLGAIADASRLSIVVLPFANLTGDAGQDYFADGLTAALTADLSRIQDALVIDSATAQSFKGKPQTAQQIGQALGVRFVLQGSVQRSGNRIRINALLADATTNKQLWTDSFDGETSNLFALQDEVTGRIANTMGHELVVVAARESEKRIEAPQAADLMLRARALADKPHSLEKWRQVEQLYRQALVIDPGNVNAMALLAEALAFQPIHVRDAALREKIWAEALDVAAKVIAIDPTVPEPYRVVAFHGLATGDLEAAQRAAENFMRLAPRKPDPFNVMGNVYLHRGEAAKALEMYTQAVNLDRKNANAVFPANVARAYFMLGDYKAAIEWNLKALQAEPQFAGAQLGLAMAYAMNGDDAKARAAAQELRRLRPNVKVDVEKLRDSSDTPAFRAYIEDKVIPAYRKAGLLD